MLSLSTLEKYHADGLLYKQTHPTHDLTIWNYTPKTQYESLWDEITLSCRGLVTNSSGVIVARPFRKFFNLEEHNEKDIPNEPFEVYTKEDGSLIIAFEYENEWVIASRGSFTSEQSIAANKLFHDLLYHEKLGNVGHTHLFEYVSDWNRIVVKYDQERLILLGMIESETGTEVDIQPLASNFFQKEVGFLDVVKKHDGIDDYRKIKDLIKDNEEGFVVRFQNGLRMKIKGEEYVRLHRIVTNISSRNIWEHLKDEKPLDDILDRVPDEFYNWVKDTVKDFVVRFDNIEKDHREIFNEIVNKVGLNDRKAFALEARQYKNHGILFSMLTGRNHKPAIWKILYPPYSKPFKKDE